MSEGGGDDMSHLTEIKIQLARQDTKLDHITETGNETNRTVKAMDSRLRKVENDQVSQKQVDDLDTRVRKVSEEQAAYSTRSNVQDGIVTLIALIAGALGINNR